MALGTFEMRKGENILYLCLAGKDGRSKGMALDLAEIIFEKAD